MISQGSLWTLLGSVSAVSFGAGMFALSRGSRVAVHQWLGLGLGSLFGLVLFHLLPESASTLGVKNTLFLGLSVFALLFLEHFCLGGADCCSVSGKKLCWTLFLAMGLCSVDDGVLLAMSSVTAHRTESWAGILLHKLFESVAVAGAVSLWTDRKSTAVAALSIFALLPLASGWAVFATGAVGWMQSLNIIPAVSAGILGFIVLSHLLPFPFSAQSPHRSRRDNFALSLRERISWPASLAGLAGMGLASMLH
jgi:hypothetical protein